MSVTIWLLPDERLPAHDYQWLQHCYPAWVNLGCPMAIPVTTYYLEMTSPQQLRGARVELSPLNIEQVRTPRAELNRELYVKVGKSWHWTDRLKWTEADWQRWAESATVQTWLARVDDVTVGYFELESQAGGNVEIAYFGLLPEFVGRGYGSHLLAAAVSQSWAMGASRVWVHTCTLDHPNALENYIARGFKVYRTEQGHQAGDQE